jgi:hypothetical protein
MTAALLCASVFVSPPQVAHACGGCFAPTGQPSVVTAHRMVVSISDQETTLWDLFEYAGNPSDFVWVLPVAEGEGVEVALAEQAFFQYLADQTTVTLQGPFTSTGGGFGCGADSGGYGASSRSVTVYAQEVVGPYETVTIGSDDVGSLTRWLADNGYVVPDSLTPTISHYVEQGMSFVVLRLSPNAGISQMQPVRVTTPGTHVTFPLRMVAAGIGDTVSIELYVIGEGRYEAQNFPNAEVDEAELTYDGATATFNYDALAAERLASNDGRTWLTEFSSGITAPTGGAYVTYDDDGYHGPLDDWLVATRHFTGSSTVTRMRAELPAGALSDDLVLQASERGYRPALYVAARATVVAPPNTNGMPGAQLIVAFVALVVLAASGARRQGQGRARR